jgi:two-component system cell cycle sensor histidine kinase/response regulator CckA
VEDEAIVRMLLERMVAQLGYDVRTAATGKEALALVAGGERFDLLLTDVVMPGMNGRKLVERVLALAPDTKVLYMSGYSVDDAGEDFLAKPFDAVELEREIRSRLSGDELQ